MDLGYTVGAFAFASITLIPTGLSQANIISGRLWHVPEATAQDAVPASVPGTTPDDVTSPLGFFADSATVSTWLSSCGAFNVSENTAGTLASLMDNGVSGTIVEFEGLVAVTTGQIFSVGHDDGLTLIIGGLSVISAPGAYAILAMVWRVLRQFGRADCRRSARHQLHSTTSANALKRTSPPC